MDNWNWVALGAIATLLLAVVTVVVVLGQNRWAVRHERTNAFKALAAEFRLNLAILKEPSGYGKSATFRHSALNLALPFVGDLSDDLQKAINDAAVAIALQTRLVELGEGDYQMGVAVELRIRRSEEMIANSEAAKTALETAAIALDRYLGRS